MLARDDAACRADARVHHGHVHRAGRKVAVGTREPEAGLDRPVSRYFVCQVDNLCLGAAREDCALHNPDEWPFVAEVGGQGDDWRHGGRSAFRRDHCGRCLLLSRLKPSSYRCRG